MLARNEKVWLSAFLTDTDPPKPAFDLTSADMVATPNPKPNSH